MFRPVLFHDDKQPLFRGFFDDFFSDMNLDSFNSFKTDVIDNGDSFTLEAELPGFKKEEIQLDLNGDYLTISANHTEDCSEEKNNYVRKERRTSSFSRSFNVSNVKVEAITAEYKDGILELNLPKTGIEQKETKKIEIK